MISLLEGLRLFRQPSTSELLARKFRKIIGKQTFRDKLADLRLGRRAAATLKDKRTKQALGILALAGANSMYQKHRFTQQMEQGVKDGTIIKRDNTYYRGNKPIRGPQPYDPLQILSNKFI